MDEGGWAEFGQVLLSWLDDRGRAEFGQVLVSWLDDSGRAKFGHVLFTRTNGWTPCFFLLGTLSDTDLWRRIRFDEFQVQW